ncbi:unnamed protein product [Microthlaspi erraticum]|uniref:Uncharacterized protein n=1 Tax=Microthlaspi erraticum TaxID=1685480 RepID=A0A6D2KX97_9BRAS|nr:unnamed protein product [Microthlaspi erraticum]
MAFPCHLLNFWRSPILLWAATTEGFILGASYSSNNSTQAHPNPHFPGPDLQLDPQLDPQLDSARSSSGSSSRKSSSCPTNVYTGGLKSMFSPLTTVVSSGLGRRNLEGPTNGCVNLNWNLPSNSLCSMRRLVLQNLMSIQPGSVRSGQGKASSSLCQIYLPLILLPSLVRERMGLIPMSRNLSSPSLMVPVAFLAKKVLASALCTYLKHWAPDLSCLGP